MLDTVVLLVPWGSYHITDHSKFSPPTDGLANFRFYAGTEFKNNPASTEQKLHYYPRLTLYTKQFYAQGRVLKIECSIPKLINDGESINEYSEADFGRAITNLGQRLRERGVNIFTHDLLKAQVVAFHVGKNIPLSGGYTATLAIQELAKIDISRRMDVNKADFRNEGHAYQFYTNSHSFVMYDKFADIRKPKGRAIDKDKHDKQLSLFDQVKNTLTQHRLLRIEVRLSTKKKVNEVLRKFQYEPNPTLENLMNHGIAKKILNYYWNIFYNQNNGFVLDIDNNPLSILRRTLHHDSNISIRQAVKAVGWHLLAKDGGIRKLREVIGKYRPKTEWHSLKKDMKIYESPPFPINTHGFVKDIKRELSTFEPYKLNLPCKEK